MAKFEIEISPGRLFEIEAQDDAQANEIAGQLSHMGNKLGLSDEDILVQTGADPNAFTPKAGPLERAGAGFLRGGQRLKNALGQLGTFVPNEEQREQFDPEFVEAQEQKLVEIEALEHTQRAAHDLIDGQDGLFSSVGPEDITELLATAPLFIGGSTAGVAAVLGLGARSAAAAFLEPTVGEESRVVNTAFGAVLGTAVAGGALGAAAGWNAIKGVVAGSRQFTGAMLYVINRARGLNRREALDRSSIMRGVSDAGQKIVQGVENRAARAALDPRGRSRGMQPIRDVADAQQSHAVARRAAEKVQATAVARERDRLLVQAQDRLAPIIQGMSRRKTDDVFRVGLQEAYRDALAPLRSRPGQFRLDSDKLVAHLSIYDDASLRGKFGKTYGTQLVEWRNGVQEAGPILERMMGTFSPDKAPAVESAMLEIFNQRALEAARSMPSRARGNFWRQRATEISRNFIAQGPGDGEAQQIVETGREAVESGRAALGL